MCGAGRPRTVSRMARLPSPDAYNSSSDIMATVSATSHIGRELRSWPTKVWKELLGPARPGAFATINSRGGLRVVRAAEARTRLVRA